MNVIAGSRIEAARGGKYEILRPLAVGGMAELFLVREPSERLAVIKQLHRKLAIDPEFVKMFLDEAHIAVTLHHPNVVEVYEICEDPEECYIVMEHLHGHDLRHTMARMIGQGAPVKLEQALSVVRAVAAGLHYTHERTGADGELLGIVHRDVSPHNVILTYGGDVKIVDFGIAKANVQLSRTRTGVLKGKVAYMAPEQAMGQPLDRRSDVFCIGILLWEMTTGRYLYRRRTELETLNAVVHNPPPRPSRIVPDYPRDLEKLVLKTLDRSAAGRFATAGELIDAIDELARRRGFALGAAAVRGLMATAFADELAAWQRAQSAGTSLGDHLVAQGASRPIAEISDEDALPPVARFDLPPRRSLRYRWPVIGAAIAAGLATVWIARASHRGAPASPATAVPGSVVPAPPAANLSAPLAPARPAPGAAGSTPGPRAVVAPSAEAGDPAHRSGATKPVAKPSQSSQSSQPSQPSQSSGTGTRPPRRAPSKPTAEQLDKLP
jgi:eukaryotic-like serine/threonine-protein kinase